MRTSTSARVIGRDAELAAISEAVARVVRGSGSRILIRGEPGIGKSLLTNETVAAARAARVRTLQAAALEMERERPFGLVARALSITMDSEDPGRVEIARLLRASAVGELPSSGTHQIADDIAGFVERAAIDHRLVLAVDDLQWTDPGSCLVLSHLARRASDLGLLIVGSCRPEPRPDHVRAVVDALTDGGTVLQLEPLAVSDVDALAACLIGSMPGTTLRPYLDRAAGNPLFVVELLSALAADGALSAVDSVVEVRNQPVPRSLRVVILRRLAQLSHETIDILKHAAVLGASFAATDLALVLDRPPSELLPPLDRALRSGVLEEDGPRLRFRHDLVWEAVYTDIPESIRIALHGQAARALGAAAADPDTVARHYRMSARPGDEEAIDWILQAARAALGTAPATAAVLFEDVLDLMPADHRQRADATFERARALQWSGRIGDAIRVLGKMPPTRFREKFLLCQLMSIHDGPRAALDYASALCEDELGAVERARALGHRARLLTEAVRYSDAGTAAVAALAAADAVGDDFARALAKLALGSVARREARYADAIALHQEAVELAERSGDPDARTLNAREVLATSLLEAGRFDEAEIVLDESIRVSEAQGYVWHLPRHMFVRSHITLFRGRFDDLLAECEATLDLALEYGVEDVTSFARQRIANVAASQGKIEIASRALDELRQSGASPSDLWAGYMVALQQGDPIRALDILRAARDACLADNQGPTPTRFAAPLTKLEVEFGRRENARSIAIEAEEHAATHPTPIYEVTALRCRAIADDDPEPVLRAVEVARGDDRINQLAGLLADAGFVLARAHRTEEARAAFEEALTIFENQRAVWHAARAEAALRHLGVRRGVRGKRSRPATGWESLTDTEERVVALAVEGLTNREIGERLYISARTVETHLGHVYAKLGIASRVQLAAASAARS